MNEGELMKELIVDNFAGGGGTSQGIKMATGRNVDIAINHDIEAIRMHKANHPNTKHFCENVWEVDPVKACEGHPVALAWFSPDCKHFSKAKGGKPVDKNIRGLAWVAVKWAKLVHPRVIMLENVEEFKTWGPLLIDNTPDPKRKGETFNLFVKALKKFGYKVEYRELRACDYGAPTIRKRFFLIARCDGKKIVWPEPTHGDPDSLEVRCGLLKPWRTAAEIIDWTLPCPSIFERKKPLAENTMKRIARGIEKFVINNHEPFIVQVNHSKAKWDYCTSINKPLATVTSHHGFGIVTPFLTQYHSYSGDSVRGQDLKSPIMTIDASNRYALTCAFLSKYYGGFYEGAGADLNNPVSTIRTKDSNALITSHLIQMNHNSIGQPVTEPLNTITAGANHFGEVRAFLLKYYGSDVGQSICTPLHTVTSKDRFGLVTIHGEDYQIVDVGMRMLTPRELFNAQGFPTDYIIDHDYEGNTYIKTEQVARCGNSVPPVFSEALVRSNLPELCRNNEKAKNVI